MFKVVSVVFGLVLLALAAAWIWAPSSRVETEIHIAATPDQVWSVLADRLAYPEWNPLITSMEGEWTPGATLVNQMQFVDGSAPVFEPTVLVVEPGRELRWLGRFLAPRIADGEHAFELEPEAQGTRLVHAETFTGLAVWFLSAESYRADFERFNRALKARVENRG